MLVGVLVVLHDAHQDLFGGTPASFGYQQRDQSPSCVVVLGVEFEGESVVFFGIREPIESTCQHVAGERVGHRHFVVASAHLDDIQKTLNRLLEPSLLYGGLSGNDPRRTLNRGAPVQCGPGQDLGVGEIAAVQGFLGPRQQDVRLGEIGFPLHQARTHQHDRHATGQQQRGNDQGDSETTCHLVLLQRVKSLWVSGTWSEPGNDWAVLAISSRSRHDFTIVPLCPSRNRGRSH